MDEVLNPGVEEASKAFFVESMRILSEADIDFLVGGAYALAHYTGVTRHTKDLDVFVRPADLDRALEALSNAGYRTEVTFEHWLGKAFQDEDFVDLIFSSRNRIAEVDDLWFEHARKGKVFGQRALITPPEETIWSKAFIMERERFDGADVAHILRACADELDWDRMMVRFQNHWHILLVHLTLFVFIYPSERHRIPSRVFDQLTVQLARETGGTPSVERLCRGTVLSGTQYRMDIDTWNYTDPTGVDPKEKS
jgi:hypothetical protein